MLRVHHTLYKAHCVFLTRYTPSPWYLFALSHWASHPAVSAFALSWKQPCDRSWVGVRDELWGNGQVFTAERREERVGGGATEERRIERGSGIWWKAERALTWKRRSREYLLPLRSKACCHCLVELTSNQPTHLSVPRVDPVSLSAACAGCFCFNWFCALYRNYPSTMFFFFFFSWERWIFNNAEGSCQMEARLQGLLRIDKSDSRDITVVWW